MDEELHIQEVLMDKYPLMTIPEYARRIGKTPNGVRYLIKKELLPTREVRGVTMIIAV